MRTPQARVIDIKKVNSYKSIPTLLDSDIKVIANYIVGYLKETYFTRRSHLFYFNCENRIKISIEVSIDEEKYNSIELDNLEITTPDGDTMELEAEQIFDIIAEKLESYNRELEFKFDASYMSKKELYAEYHL